MTYEEARRILLSDFHINEEPSAMAMVKAVEALEKQIPKKPLPDNESYLEGICPTCNVYFLDRLTEYCGNCGQALDWSDGNE